MKRAKKVNVQRLIDKIQADIERLCGMIYEACPNWPDSAATNEKDQDIFQDLTALVVCMAANYMELRRRQNRSLKDLNDRLDEMVSGEGLWWMTHFINNLQEVFDDFERQLGFQMQSPNN